MSSFDLAKFNVERASLAINTLFEQGVHHFCLSPGSRSTPLAIAIAEHPKAQSSIHFDERGLGFYALGIAKATNTPVVLLVTTGTAVANLFPALVEAHLSRIPLILLSADRPPELRDCGSNQTADHVKIFGSFTRWDIDLAFSDPLAPDSYIASTLAYAVDCSRKSPSGPVQVNCMIREPFIYLENERRQTLSSCVYEPKGSLPPIDSFELWGTLLSQKKKGVLLLGSDALTQEDLPSFLRFAEKLGWPIFSDIISGGRGIGNHPCHIEHIELILKVFPEIQVDAILQIGNRIVSKTVQQWINNQKEVPYLLVADHPFRQDPLHKITRRMECSSKLFCDILIDKISLETDSWAPFWKKISNEVKEEISDHFLEKDLFSEPALFQFLKDFTSSFPFFLSSSMPIRDADLLFFPSDGTSSLFSNRGASGIDGNIATAAGISKGLQKPLVAVLGDLATLHDLNSFSLAAKSKNPILFVIINNQGGGIFSFLPVAEKKDLFEEFIATSHDYSFDSIAKTFSLNYECVDSLKDWGSAWDNAIHSKTSCIIECKTQRGSNVLHHHQLLNEVRKRLCSSTKHLEILRALLPYSSCMAF